MKILVIGGGGREHALVWKLRQNPRVEKIWCAPGNGGIAQDAQCIAVDTGDVSTLVELARSLRPDLTVVGPELPLSNGISDAFVGQGWRIVGPLQRAARLESSKIFAKEFLLRHGIPTAKMYGRYDSASAAREALSSVRWPLVMKADGLCAGKGVVLADDKSAANAFIESALEKDDLGAGGKRILFEEMLEGEELSFIILTDGERYASMVPARDHKRIFQGNKGPNTGGMGAYSSDELLPEKLRQRVIADIVEPTLRGLSADEIPYQGFLYIGLMLTAEGPKVLEFNCRLGDPEAQAIVARMDFDLAEVLMDVAEGKLDPARVVWKNGASVCVVAASAGYPGAFSKGKKISGLTSKLNEGGVNVFHAGTRLDGDVLVTSGGRVLGVTAIGSTVEEAARVAYSVLGQIHFDGIQYRRDIGVHADHLKAAGS